MKFHGLKPRIEIWNNSEANRAALIAQLDAINSEISANASSISACDAEIDDAKAIGFEPPPPPPAARWLARCIEQGRRKSYSPARRLVGDAYEYEKDEATGASAFTLRAHSAYALACAVLVEAKARRISALTIIFKHADESGMVWENAAAGTWRECFIDADAHISREHEDHRGISIDLFFPQPRGRGRGFFFKPFSLPPPAALALAA